MKKMNDWNDIPARMEATWAFCEYLRTNPGEVQTCLDSSDYAKRLFATHGNFYVENDAQAAGDNLHAIPLSTQFNIYKKNPLLERDHLVTIVLPDPTPNPIPKLQFVPSEVYRCTWPLYLA